MTSTEYWRKEIDKAVSLNLSQLAGQEPAIIAGLLVSGQLQAITTVLAEIRSQLDKIEDSIANQ